MTPLVLRTVPILYHWLLGIHREWAARFCGDEHTGQIAGRSREVAGTRDWSAACSHYVVGHAWLVATARQHH